VRRGSSVGRALAFELSYLFHVEYSVQGLMTLWTRSFIASSLMSLKVMCCGCSLLFNSRSLPAISRGALCNALRDRLLDHVRLIIVPGEVPPGGSKVIIALPSASGYTNRGAIVEGENNV
jgi:hypothetical protein